MVNEMEKRYHMFSNTGTKKIEGYNEYVEKWNKAHPDEQLEKMPFIVVIIDELDLMMVAAKEVEDSILRITQKARLCWNSFNRLPYKDLLQSYYRFN